jgi:isopropylmalate/homocitrate/citramalate synthase
MPRTPEIPVFKKEEVEHFQSALGKYREPGAYEPGKWMVSHLNRRADVLQGTFPAEVTLRDITVRTTEQMPGVVLPPDDRLRLLRAVVESGVPSIQIGAFGRGRELGQIKSDIKLIKDINPKCEVVYGGLRSKEDIDLANETGIDSVQFWSAPYVEAAAMFSDVYRKAWNGEDWRSDLNLPKNVDDQIQRVAPLVAHGNASGVRVSVGLNQISFAPEDYVITYSQAMHQIATPEIMLYDGGSGMGPEAYAHMVSLVRQHAPNSIIGVHTHNMFDLAVATAMASAKAGASVLEVSVNGYCSASGQADLAATALTLDALYGVKTGIALETLTPLARLAEEIVGYKVAWNNPVTGREVFNWGGTEFVIQELKVDPLIHWCIEPSLVGNERRWDITFDSGPYTMLDKLIELEINVDLQFVEPILQAVKEEMQKLRRVLDDDEIHDLVQKITN